MALKKVITFFLFFTQSLTLNSLDLSPAVQDNFRLVKDLSLAEKVGQLFMVRSARDTSVESIERLIKQCHVGGVFHLPQESITDQINITNHFQRFSCEPLLVGQDLEWGLNMRHTTIPKFPYASTLGKLPADKNNLIHAMGKRVAQHARALGVHFTACPVLDVNTNPENPVIGFRSFGSTPEKVIEKGMFYIRGLQEGGALACAKHFPGHGDTKTDSHVGKTYLVKSHEQLEKIELAPFAAAIQADVDMVMSGHLLVPSLDLHKPATLSPTIITGLLKNKLRFNGLAITDALDMGAISAYHKPVDAVIQAFVAGNDILLFPGDVEASHKALTEFISENKQYQDQLDCSVQKILNAKKRLNLYVNRYVDQIVNPEKSLYTQYDYDLKYNLFKYGITLHVGKIPTGDKKTVINLDANMDTFNRSIMADNNAVLLNNASSYENLQNIVVTFSTTARGKYEAEKRKRLQEIVEKNPQAEIILVLFGDPYVLAQLPGIANVLVACEPDPDAQKAAAEIILGKNDPLDLNIQSDF